MKRTNRSYELPTRLLCTTCILAIYLIGRNINLYMADAWINENQTVTAQSFLENLMSGGSYQCSVFALGLMPYMTASILIQIGAALLPKDVKKRISQPKMEKAVLLSTLVYSVFLSNKHVSEMSYLPSQFSVQTLQMISVAELVLFTILLVGMIQINKEQGIGQQTPIILVNVAEGIYSAVSNNQQYITFTMLLICMVILVITIIMENVEYRIPVQRVSIHNIYANKNYIAFKLNPVGIMPVMFSISVFILIKYLLYFIGGIFPQNTGLLWINAHMDLSTSSGVWIYLAVIFLLTIVSAFVMLQPRLLAENLQKGGDSIVGVYAGKPTIRYFVITVLFLSMLSGLVLACCMGVSLFLGLKNSVPQELAMLPSSLMIVVGILSNLIEEIKGYHKFDSYRFFI